MCPLESFPEVKSELVQMLLAMREVGTSLHAGFVQLIIIGFLEEKAPGVLKKLKVSISWTKRFMRTQLNWRFRKPTTVKEKLSKD
jgi:hypothetical protein